MRSRRHDSREADLGLNRRSDIERDVDDEIALHLELRIERLVAQGYSADEARSTAMRRFGPLDDARAQLRATAGTRIQRMRLTDRLDSFRQDVAYSVRQLRRSPGFAAAVIVTLGLGIGANATMFGAIDQLLLRPPAHVADPGRLVTITTRDLRRDASHVQRVLSFPIYQDLERAHDAFGVVGVYQNANVDFGAGATVKSVPAVLATARYFEALGVRPYEGRFFSADEAGDAPGAPVAVLGYSFWQREFDGDHRVIGRTVQFSGAPHTIVGIAPDGFDGVELTNVDVFLPLTDAMSAQTVAALSRARQTYAYLVVGRLARGVTVAHAADVATAAVDIGSLNSGQRASELEALGRRVELTSALPRDARGTNPESRVAELLGAVSLFVLLLACANVMNLQLARGITRRREIAVRVALGVNRGRLVRQLALDCLLLSAAGAVAGILIAQFGGRFVRRSLLGGSLGALSPVDGRVLVFSLLLALAVGLVTGLVPAAEMLRSNLVISLKEGARSGDSRRTTRLRATLLASQAALTTVLLVGTGLFVSSLHRIEAIPLGFDPSSAGYARLNMSGKRAQPISDETAEERAQIRATFRRLEQAARQTPGVTAAATALTAPFEGGYAFGVRIPGRDSVALTRDGGPYYNAVSADYFTTIGAEIAAGRAFTSSDDAHAPQVLIVNETAARLWWPGEGAVGRCVILDDDAKAPCAQVVGVVRNMHRQKIVEDDFVQIFVPVDQSPVPVPGVILFRAPGQIDRVLPLVQKRLQGAVAGLPSVNARPLEALVAPRLRSWTLGAAMFGIFGALALLLAAVGLYGVLAYDVAQHRHELGVRRALGAASGNIAGLVMRRGVLTMCLGLLAGTSIAIAARRLIEPLLFQTSPFDPLVIGAVWVVMAVITVASTSLPAWRASCVDPTVALRGD